MKRLEDLDEQELKELCNAMAANVERAARVQGVERPHFALVIFNDPKVAQYVSNCQRTDMIVAMRATADRLERREDVTR
jgi:hypothetical protein